MTSKFFTANKHPALLAGQRGFTIFELIVVITMMGTLAAVYAPKLVATKQNQAVAREIAKNVTMLIDAAKLFHYNDPEADGRDWPTDIAELKAHNYINASWTPSHAFGGTFTLGVVDPNLHVTVTSLPADMQNVVRQAVPGWTYTATTSTGASVVPPLGFEPSIDHKVNRSGDTMWGDLVMTEGSKVVVRDSTGADQAILGEEGGNYGLHGTSTAGNLWLSANTAGVSGRVYVQTANGIEFLDSAGATVASISNTGALNAKDAILRDLSLTVPLSQNTQWVVYSGIHGANESVVAPALGGGYTNATYEIFVAPTFFEGAASAGGDIYPVNSVRCWAVKTATDPPSWTVKIQVKDSENNVYGATGTPNNQRAWVVIMATI